MVAKGATPQQVPPPPVKQAKEASESYVNEASKVKSEVKIEVQGGPEKEQVRKEIEKLIRDNNKEREHVLAQV
jgi:hypothetical protein